MRTPLAFAAVLAAFAVSLPAQANTRGLQIDAAAPLSSPVATVSVSVDPDIINRRARYHPMMRTSYVGPRDADALARDLNDAILRALAERGLSDAASGAPGAVIEAVITEASPDNPGFTEVGFRARISAVSSRSRGGAEVEATLRDASGAVIGTYSYRYFEPYLDDIGANGAWTEARRTFDRFADRLADELVRQVNEGR